MRNQRLDKFVQGMLKPINPNASIILGILTNFWGIWLLLPHDVFDTASVYSRMDQFAPEWAWGLWAFFCGLSVIVSILKSNWCWLARSMGFAVWHWCTVSGMMWWSNWQDTGGLTYTFISIYAIYVYLNVKVNYVRFGEEFTI